MLKPEKIEISRGQRIPLADGEYAVEIIATAKAMASAQAIQLDSGDNRNERLLDDAIRRAKRGVYDAVYGEVAASIQRTIVETELARKSSMISTPANDFGGETFRRIETVIENLRKLLDKIDPPELRG